MSLIDRNDIFMIRITLLILKLSDWFLNYEMSDKEVRTIKSVELNQGYKPNSYSNASLHKRSLLQPSKFTFDKLTLEINKDLSKKDLERLQTPKPTKEDIKELDKVDSPQSFRSQSIMIRPNSGNTSPKVHPNTPIKTKDQLINQELQKKLENCSDGWKSQLQNLKKEKKKEYVEAEWKRVVEFRRFTM